MEGCSKLCIWAALVQHACNPPRAGPSACQRVALIPHRPSQVYGLSGPVARYIGRNGPILHRFANEDVTLGAWLVGLEVTHVDERRLCCDSAERCQAQVGFPQRVWCPTLTGKSSKSW